VAAVLDKLGATYRLFDPAESRMSERLLAFRPDVAFLAMHGPGGEDGTLQGFLETLQIPYVGSGVAASAICMNKLYTKWVFEALRIPTPRWTIVDPFESPPTAPAAVADLTFPVVVKPLCEGSSVGVEFVASAADLRALAERRRTTLLVEERIVGRELTIPMTGDPLDVLPIIEIRPKTEFFDFDAKYTKGMTDYICPADISSDVLKQLQVFAGRIARALQLRHMCRIDLLLGSPAPARRTQTGVTGDRAGLYFLEINTIPGLTETSLVPMAARAAGISFPELIRRWMEMAQEHMEKAV